MNPAPHYGKPHKDVPEADSDTPITKTVKKEGIRWLVPALLTLFCVALVALARLQVSSMLSDYETKEQAKATQQALQYQLDQQRKEYLDLSDKYSKKIEDLSHLVNQIDKKMDRLQFTLEWMQQHEPRNGTPKDQTNP